MWLECACSWRGHVVCVSYDLDEEWEWGNELSINVQMHPHHGFWQRLKTAFRYVFSLNPCAYGTWGGPDLSDEKVDELIQFLQDFKSDKAKFMGDGK